jgi:Glutamine cyclotransferase
VCCTVLQCDAVASLAVLLRTCCNAILCNASEHTNSRMGAVRQVWGNVWQTDCVARIDPSTAAVTGWVLLHGLAERTRRAGVQRGVPMDVLNGIAHDPRTGRLFVTGKYWGRLYEIRVVERDSSEDSVGQARSLCIPQVHGMF